MAAGALLSGFFVVATDAWMQHPVGFRLVDGRAELTSLWQLLTNPYLGWQFAHVVSGSLVTAAMVMAGVGAWFVLSGRHDALGRVSLRVGVIAAAICAITSLVPTGAGNGENVTAFQPAKMAAMEGLFTTQTGAPMAIIGMPDAATRTLTDPIYVPRVLSYLAYGDTRATVPGLDQFPPEDQPPLELVYYAYHIMVGLGTLFIAVTMTAAGLLWRGRLFQARWMLWTLMLAIPFPYIANQAGWLVAEVGRQPWLVYGVLRTGAGVSRTVTAGMTWFSLIGFMGLYLLLGLLYVTLFLRIVWRGGGPDEHGATEALTAGAR